MGNSGSSSSSTRATRTNAPTKAPVRIQSELAKRVGGSFAGRTKAEIIGFATALDNGDRALAQVAMKLCNNELAVLDLTGRPIVEHEFVVLCYFLAHTTACADVKLRGCQHFTVQAATLLGAALKLNNSVGTLDLGAAQLGEQHMFALRGGLIYNHSVNSLSLDGNDLRVEGVMEVAELLKQNSGIQRIDLSENNLNNPGGACCSFGGGHSRQAEAWQAALRTALRANPNAVEIEFGSQLPERAKTDIANAADEDTRHKVCISTGRSLYALPHRPDHDNNVHACLVALQGDVEQDLVDLADMCSRTGYWSLLACIDDAKPKLLRTNKYHLPYLTALVARERLLEADPSDSTDIHKVAHYAVDRMRHLARQRINDVTLARTMTGLLLYAAFLVAISVVAIGASVGESRSHFFAREAIEGRLLEEEFDVEVSPFVKTFHDVGNVEELWMWLRGPFQAAVFPEPGVPANSTHDRDISAITVGPLAAVCGAVRFRVVRNSDCTIGPREQSPSNSSTSEGEALAAARRAFWDTLCIDSTGAVDRSALNLTNLERSPVQWRSAEELKSQTPNGRLRWSLEGEGHVIDLDTADPVASAELLEALEAGGEWLHPSRTRAAFLDGSFWIPSLEVMVVMRISLEFTAGGDVIPQAHFDTMPWSRDAAAPNWAWYEFALMGWVAFTFFRELAELAYATATHGMRIGAWRYFTSVWNIMDLLASGLLTLGFWWRREQVQLRDSLGLTPQTPGGEYWNLQELAVIEQLSQKVMSIAVSLSYLLSLKLFESMPYVGFIVTAIMRSVVSSTTITFLLLFLFVIQALAWIPFLGLGPNVASHSTFVDSTVATFLAAVGDFDIDAFRDGDYLFGTIAFIATVILASIVLTNLFIAVLSEVYADAARQASKEWEANRDREIFRDLCVTGQLNIASPSAPSTVERIMWKSNLFVIALVAWIWSTCMYPLFVVEKVLQLGFYIIAFLPVYLLNLVFIMPIAACAQPNPAFWILRPMWFLRAWLSQPTIPIPNYLDLLHTLLERLPRDPALVASYKAFWENEKRNKPTWYRWGASAGGLRFAFVGNPRWAAKTLALLTGAAFPHQNYSRADLDACSWIWVAALQDMLKDQRRDAAINRSSSKRSSRRAEGGSRRGGRRVHPVTADDDGASTASTESGDEEEEETAADREIAGLQRVRTTRGNPQAEFDNLVTLVQQEEAGAVYDVVVRTVSKQIDPLSNIVSRIAQKLEVPLSGDSA